MDHSRFDDLARRLGAVTTRRAGLRAALGGALGLAGLAAAGGERGAAKRRCRRDSPPGQCCKKDGTCTCKNGGTVCGDNCCLLGQSCENGACVAGPQECIALGQACKATGRPCCAGLACGSGQGGQTDVACYHPAGASCASTAECAYGTSCIGGTCVANETCLALGVACETGDLCCEGICGYQVGDSSRQPIAARCCLVEGQACTSDAQCCGLIDGAGGRIDGVQCDPTTHRCTARI